MKSFTSAAQQLVSALYPPLTQNQVLPNKLWIFSCCSAEMCTGVSCISLNYLYSCSEAGKNQTKLQMLRNLALWTQTSQNLPVTLTRWLMETWSHSSHKNYDGSCLSIAPHSLTFTWILAQIINCDDVSHQKSSISHLKDPLDAICWREIWTKIRMGEWKPEV